MVKNKSLVIKQTASIDMVSEKLLKDIRLLIDSTRTRVAQVVNTGLVMLYWHIGNRIRKDIIGKERAPYGEQIVATLSPQLTFQYGSGYEISALFRMIKFAEKYPNKQIVATLSQQLGWSHFKELITIKDELKRNFYTEMCRIERWSVRGLNRKIGSMLFERTALSRKPKELAKIELKALREEDKMTPDIAFRDPYFLDFLGLKDTFSEKDLESAIIRELGQFIIEIGTDFSFMARQKRISIGGNDYYLDLLFYHRRLKCLVAVELKLDKFKPEYKGQMELYLKWLEKHDMCPGENKPIGLILCATKNHEEIELLELDKSGIKVSEYWTKLLPKEMLVKKLHDMMEFGKKLIENHIKNVPN